MFSNIDRAKQNLQCLCENMLCFALDKRRNDNAKIKHTIGSMSENNRAARAARTS